MSDTAHIPLLPEQCDILKQSRDAFCKALEAKFDCTAIFHHLEDSDSFGSNASDVSGCDLRYYIRLPGGVKVSVCKDDLTRHKVDTVVNAANEMLCHGGGLALALSRAGGPQIQQLSDQIIKAKGSVATGTAVVTPAGNLPCKRIIHAVGPCLSFKPDKWQVDNAAPLLRDTVRNILEIVVKEDIPSVAIPALSSGLFNFPRHLCADIIVKVIKEYNTHNAFRGRDVEIRLVNNDEPSVKEMERACIKLLGSPTLTGSYSGAVKGINQSMTSSSGNSLQLGNITLHLKKGLIEEQKVDVIVNTISNTLDLSSGVVSKAILTKAGKKIQEELSRNKKSFTSGEIFVTKGYNLKCSNVFHTVCAFRSQYDSLEILHKVVFNCLVKAVSGSAPFQSIAFPAIGTGNLGFQKHEVAKIMIDAVAVFAKKKQSTNLEVNFVVFPEDTTMMEAFENKLKWMKGEMKSSHVPNAMAISSAFGSKEPTRNETPTLEISSASKEALREAQAWTMNMLKPQKGSITIMNNHVMYFNQNNNETLLSFQTMFDVHIKVFFRNGNGGISITGEPVSVGCVAVRVESMLCQAQNDFAVDEESGLLYSVVHWHCKDALLSPKVSAALEKAYLARDEEIELHDYNIKASLRNMTLVDFNGTTSSLERKCLFMDYNHFHLASKSFYARTPEHRKDYMELEKKIKACGLSIIRVEKIENVALQQIFELNRKRVIDKPKPLYQCVSAQFCDLICRVGFQKDFAPPAEQMYGSGIYFSSTLDNALKLWNGQKEEYIYIIQAQVLTGKSTIGSPDFILPPPLATDPLKRYDSVTDMRYNHVIFSGQQALPEYLIICDRKLI